MPFLLKKGGSNVPLEVQRWQHFLLKQGDRSLGRVDAEFGNLTRNATLAFQRAHGVPETGELDVATLQVAEGLGYFVAPDNHYDGKTGLDWPPPPDNLESPSHAWRTREFGCFRFEQQRIDHRDRPERVVILGSCDGTVSDWEDENIVRVSIPELSAVSSNFDAVRVRCHRTAEAKVRQLFAAWEQANLMHLVIAYLGAFDPRYKKNKSPGDLGHPSMESRDVPDLSNHAYGTAFDINADQNPFSSAVPPERVPKKGAVRELVPIANGLGFYWGGHYNSTKDGMHFELAAL